MVKIEVIICMVQSMNFMIQSTNTKSLLTFKNNNTHLFDPPTPFQDWDFLIFSQRWPISACTAYQEQKPNNTCNMPAQNSLWTIHGVWPNKIGKMGPFFCDSALHYDDQQIEPIRNDLQSYWTNIEANTKANSLWKHEWSKHGTCASVLPLLNSVTNYFQRGLIWNKEYPLSEILKQSGIIPNAAEGYGVEVIGHAVQSVTGKKPSIHCVVDTKTKQSLIDEIRICFNKEFDLIDCDISNEIIGNFERGNEDVLTDCSRKKPIMYLENIPHLVKGVDNKQALLDRYTYMQRLIDVYNMIKFTIWATL